MNKNYIAIIKFKASSMYSYPLVLDILNIILKQAYSISDASIEHLYINRVGTTLEEIEDILEDK